MRLTLLASFATASALLCALICVDVRAEVSHNCITTLEAQPADAPPKPTSGVKKPCPVAVAFTRRQRPAPGSVNRDATNATMRTLADPGVRA